MSEKWDGKPRRKEDGYLDVIIKKQEQQYAFLKNLFGDVDLSGNAIEGSLSRTIRLIEEQCAKTNGRLSGVEAKVKELSGWRDEIEVQIKDRKERILDEAKDRKTRNSNRFAFIGICVSIITMVTAIVMIFKK